MARHNHAGRLISYSPMYYISPGFVDETWLGYATFRSRFFVRYLGSPERKLLEKKQRIPKISHGRCARSILARATQSEAVGIFPVDDFFPALHSFHPRPASRLEKVLKPDREVSWARERCLPDSCSDANDWNDLLINLWWYHGKLLIVDICSSLATRCSACQNSSVTLKGWKDVFVDSWDLPSIFMYNVFMNLDFWGLHLHMTDSWQQIQKV